MQKSIEDIPSHLVAGVLKAEREKDESKSSGGGVGEEWGTLAGWGAAHVDHLDVDHVDHVDQDLHCSCQSADNRMKCSNV